MNTSSHVDFIVYKRAYYVQVDHSSHLFNLIAIRPKINLKTSRIEWEDTTFRGKSVVFKELKIDGLDFSQVILADVTPKKIEVISTHNEEITLHLLTLETFNNQIKKHVMCGGKLNFISDEEVQNFYLNKNFTVY